MDPMVVSAQEQQLAKMKSRKQQPNMVPSTPAEKPLVEQTLESLDQTLPLINADQTKREQVAKEGKEKQKFGIRHAVAGLGDIASAVGKPYGASPTSSFKDLQERLKKESDESKAELEKQFLDDPNSDASKIAQQAAARLLNKTPQDLEGMSLNQINAVLPMWKEAVSNEQNQELKEMALAFSAQQKEEGKDLKREQFEALKANREQLSEDRKARRDLQERQQLETKVQRHATEMQKAGLPELVSTYNELHDVFTSGKDVKGLGFLESHVPGALLSSEAVRNRTNLQQMANALLKSRSGAAVSDQEYRRFLLELQAGKFPTERSIKAHLGKMGQDARTIIGQLEAGLPQEALQEYKSHPGAVTATDVNDPEALSPKPTKSIMKKEYSPSRNKTRITYSDGTQEILDGRN